MTSFVAVLGRRLRPGATPDDFVRAWYPDRGFGAAMRGPIVAAQEAVRHDRIEAVVESSRVHAIDEVLAEYDFSNDETVEAGRPPAAGGA